MEMESLAKIGEKDEELKKSTGYEIWREWKCEKGRRKKWNDWRIISKWRRWSWQITIWSNW
jgi:hypothetical protein